MKRLDRLQMNSSGYKRERTERLTWLKLNKGSGRSAIRMRLKRYSRSYFSKWNE
jgi:hypothetical protein